MPEVPLPSEDGLDRLDGESSVAPEQPPARPEMPTGVDRPELEDVLTKRAEETEKAQGE